MSFLHHVPIVLFTHQTLCTYVFRDILGAIMNKYFKLIFNTSVYTNNITCLDLMVLDKI